MSSGYQLKDLTDLVDAVARELKIQDADEVERERIKEDLNDIYLNEVASQKRWPWLRGHTQVQHKPYYGSGTVSVTPDSQSITFSTAPSASLGSFKGRKFAVDNFNEVYEITAHTAGSTSATIATNYTGALNATASFKVWKEYITLPTDCRETIEVWHNFFNQPLEPLGLQEFRKRQAESPKAQGRPVYYHTYDFEDPTADTDETESDRYRVMKLYPSIYSDSTTINIDYVKEVSHLSEDGDEPLMPMEDRMVLVYGARALAWTRHRNPEESERNWQRFNNKLARMMGKVEEASDKPQLTMDSLYVARKRGPRLKSLRGANTSSGSGGSYTSPTYASNITLAGGTITSNFTVSSGVTIDGRDLSADGSALDAHLAGTSSQHSAEEIVNVPSGNLAATDVQAALNELQSDVDTRATSASLNDHITDAADAHAASAITNTPSGNLAATTVQGALNELQTDVDTRALDADLDAHVADTTDAHAASAITNTPSGNLAATTVQGALNELQTDVDTRETVTNVNAKFNTSTGHDHDGTDSKKVVATNLDSTGGSSGQVLRADGSGGSSWGSAVGNLTVVTKTSADSPYSATSSDDVVLCDGSSGAITVNLPAAASNSGKVLYFEKTDSTTNNITIDGNGSETIREQSVFRLTTQFETVRIISDGSNWRVLSHDCETPYTLYSPTVSGFGTSPTVVGRWKRDGDHIDVIIRVTVTNTGGGLGAISFDLPGLATARTSDIPGGNVGQVGTAYWINSSTGAMYTGAVILQGSTTTMSAYGDSGATRWTTSTSAGVPANTSTNTVFQFILSLPVTNWEY